MQYRFLADNLAAVKARIATAATAAGRDTGLITLVGASKSQPPAAIQAAVDAGLRDLGESYVQEAVAKMAALPPDLPVTWHFIGQLQANKTRAVAEHFAWVHTVDRLRIAERLSAQRPFHSPPLNICAQVNIGGQDTKGGVDPIELLPLLRQLAQLPRLRLRGLMCLPPPETDPARQRHWLGQLHRLFEAAQTSGLPLDTLSMGMSGDLEAAIAEGTTLVRVGTDIFGPRTV